MSASQWRPRVKPEHGLRRTREGRVRIGGVVYGIAAEVEDPTGAVWTLLGCADGTRTVDEIVRHVLDTHPGERAETVAAAVEQFAVAGYLENAVGTDIAGLTARERERYDRSRRFYRWIDLNRRDSSWEPQLRLKAAKVTVLGLGGTGGTAALSLAASGVGRIHCVDRDSVELSNLNRQTQFDENDLARLKADATVSRLRRMNSDIAVTGETATITGEEDLDVLVKDCDVFMLCADKPGEIRAWANKACLRAGTPWVNAGYHGPDINAYAFTPGSGPCYECFWLQEHERTRDILPKRPYSVTRGSKNAVTAVSAGLSGHLAAHLAIALITGIPQIDPGQSIGFNLAVNGPNEQPPYNRHPYCPACGNP